MVQRISPSFGCKEVQISWPAAAVATHTRLIRSWACLPAALPLLTLTLLHSCSYCNELSEWHSLVSQIKILSSLSSHYWSGASVKVKHSWRHFQFKMFMVGPHWRSGTPCIQETVTLTKAPVWFCVSENSSFWHHAFGDGIRCTSLFKSFRERFSAFTTAPKLFSPPFLW